MASYPFRYTTRPRCGRFSAVFLIEHATSDCALQLSLPSLTRSYRCGRVRIIEAMTSVSTFSHTNAPLKNGESILADAGKIFSLLSAAILSTAMDVVAALAVLFKTSVVSGATTGTPKTRCCGKVYIVSS